MVRRPIVVLEDGSRAELPQGDTLPGGGLTITTFEVNLCATGRRSGSFNIAGLSNLTQGKKVLVDQAAGPYTSKGVLPDEAEMDMVNAKGYVVDASTIEVFWNSQYHVRGNFKFNYVIQS